MNLAFKELRHQMVRFGVTCTLIGLLLGTVLAQAGVYRGLIEDSSVLIDSAGADVWVQQARRYAPFAEASMVPPDIRRAIARLPGVARTGAVIYDATNLHHGGDITRVTFVGYEDGRPGSPPAIAEGRGIRPRRREAVADRSLGISVGEVVTLREVEFRVVGLVEGVVTTVGDPVVYVDLRDAQELLFDLGGPAQRRRVAAGGSGRTGDFVTAVAVVLEPEADLDAAVERIRRWKHLSALTHDGFVDYLENAVIIKVRQQIAVFGVLLLFVVLVVISLTIYVMTMEKLRSIAILKLIGARDSLVVGMIAQQSLMLGGAGLLLGHAMVFAVRDVFPRRVVLEPSDMFVLALVTLAVCLVGSLIGMRLALSVEPVRALAD